MQANQPGQGAQRIAALLGLGSILVVAPLFYLFLSRDIFVLPKTLPLALGALILCALWLARGSSSRASMSPAIVILGAAVLLTALVSADYPLSILGPHQQQFYAVIPLSLCALAFYGGVDVSPDDATRLAIIGGCLAAIPALSIDIGVMWFNDIFSWFGDWRAYVVSIPGNRPGATFGSPVFLGAYLSLVLPLAWANARERGAPILYALPALMGISLWNTQSRGAMLGVLAAVCFYECCSFGRMRKFLLASGCVATAVAIAVFVRRHDHLSNLGHIEVWRIGWRAFLARPVFGWGPDTFSLAFRQFLTPAYIASENGRFDIIQLSAHNDLLQALATMGAVGGAAYAFFCWRAWRLLRDRLQVSHGRVIAAGLIGVFVQAKFNPVPLSVLVACAVLLASLENEAPSIQGRLRPAGATLAASLLCVIFSVMLTAEHHQRRAEMTKNVNAIIAAEEMNVAAQLNPFDLWYTQVQLDYFWKIAPVIVRGGVPGPLLAAFTHNISERVGRLHPLDPTAHELRALSYKFEGDMIGANRFWEADHELEVAERLAPHFKNYTQRRAEFAAMFRKRRRGA